MPAHTSALGQKLITVGKKVLKSVDLISIMRILTLLTIPFKLWSAYKTGVIDEKGKVHYIHDGYAPGDEKKLKEVLDKLADAKK